MYVFDNMVVVCRVKGTGVSLSDKEHSLSVKLKLRADTLSLFDDYILEEPDGE